MIQMLWYLHIILAIFQFNSCGRECIRCLIESFRRYMANVSNMIRSSTGTACLYGVPSAQASEPKSQLRFITHSLLTSRYINRCTSKGVPRVLISKLSFYFPSYHIDLSRYRSDEESTRVEAPQLATVLCYHGRTLIEASSLEPEMRIPPQSQQKNFIV